MDAALINATISVDQICCVRLKMAKQFVHAQVNLDSFLVLLKMAVFVMHLYVPQIMIVVLESVATVNAQLPVEIKTIALMVNIVRTIGV